MAQRFLMYYRVPKPVGEGRPNMRDDVLLVQYFLTKVIENGWIDITVNRKMKGMQVAALKPLAVNGIADDNLYNWIFFFQLKSRQNFGGTFPLPLDSVVDPVHGPVSGKEFSNRTLGELQKLAMGKLSQLFNNLWDDPSVPTELRESLRKNWV